MVFGESDVLRVRLDDSRSGTCSCLDLPFDKLIVLCCGCHRLEAIG